MPSEQVVSEDAPVESASNAPPADLLSDDQPKSFVSDEQEPPSSLSLSDDLNVNSEESATNTAVDEDLDEPTHSLPTPDELKVDLEKNISEAGAENIEETNNHSLPHVEEVRSQQRSDPFSIPCAKKYVPQVLLCLVALIVGLSVGLTRDNSSGSTDQIERESRYAEVIDFLSEISDPKALTTEGTPQAHAADWIANTDEFYAVPESVYSDIGYRFIQRYVLSLLWYTMGGTTWANQLFFLTSRGECEWAERFVVGDEVFQVGVTCEGDKVTTLFMPGNNLQGELPDELGWLTNLNHLSLFYNDITGSFPRSLQRLTALDFLAVQNNNVSGELPEWISKLTNLRIIGLNHNELTGTLPQGMAALTNLQELSLDDNNFSGDIAVLEPLTELRGLYLSGNFFDAELHDEMLVDLQKLEYLDLSDNQFQGILPGHFLNFNELKVLELRKNQLSGNFPQYVADNRVLEYLTLVENNMEGPLPDSLQELRGLKHLNLGSNSFNGEMPAFLGDMSLLNYILLDNNDFVEGPIPEKLRNLERLRGLSLERTGRVGSLPEWIGSFGSMTYLNLARNGLNGSIPESVGDLEDIEFLFLNRNELTGMLPGSIDRLSNLEMLLIDKNRLWDDEDNLICDGDDIILESLKFFVSDCAGNEPEVICPCCTTCCVDEDDTCSDFAYVEYIDENWQDYTREAHVFSEEIVFQVKPNKL